MGTATLVNFDIENGEKVIGALDAADKSPNVALWAKLPDYESWRLIIASEHLDQSSSLAGYSEILYVLNKAGITGHRQPSLLLWPMENPFVKELRRIFASTSDVYGMRLGGQTFGGKYLEDAFVYRIR